MNIAEATVAPRMHHQWLPDELRVEEGFSPDTVRLLEGMGPQGRGQGGDGRHPKHRPHAGRAVRFSRRIDRLPPYVFNVVGDLKMAARRRGEDIIDFSMGNPDQPTPKHIVDKMVEAAQRGDTHRYSVSRGIPRLRLAICNWYKTRYDVDIDPDKEAIVTIGSKEGLAHLAMATVDRGDAVLVPNPAYPIHPYGFVIAGADIRHVPIGPGVDFFSRAGNSAIKNSWPQAQDAGAQLSEQPDRAVRRSRILRARGGGGARAQHLRGA
jgi:hypothetical protein